MDFSQLGETKMPRTFKRVQLVAAMVIALAACGLRVGFGACDQQCRQINMWCQTGNAGNCLDDLTNGTCKKLDNDETDCQFCTTNGGQCDTGTTGGTCTATTTSKPYTKYSGCTANCHPANAYSQATPGVGSMQTGAKTIYTCQGGGG